MIFNVHMPAFDGGSLRRRQLIDVLRLLQAEYEAGNHVVAGGDWNLRLAVTSFPYSTAERHKSWVRDLPPDLTPPGWSWAVDASTPTNRTLEQSYRPGVNYTSVIDGFLVSPNVEILGVETQISDSPTATTIRFASRCGGSRGRLRRSNAPTAYMPIAW